MNMAIEADRTGQLKGLIQQGVQIGECPRSFNEVLFLYRIMYSVYCSDVRDEVLHKRALPREIVGNKTDYLLSGNEWYSQTMEPVINPSELIKTNGGATMFTIYQMLTGMRVKFVVKYKDNYKDGRFRVPQLYDLRNSDPQDPEGRRHRLDEFSSFINKLTYSLNSYVRDCDIILNFFPRRYNKRIEMTITAPEGIDVYKYVGSAPPEDFGEDFLMDNGEEPLEYVEDPDAEEPLEYVEGPDTEYFDLQFGTIVLHGDNFDHSIVGYFCNGKPQTYDSANNKINFSDWTALNNPEVKAGLLQDVSSYFSTHLTEAYISCCVYLNRTKITDYTKLGKCPV